MNDYLKHLPIFIYFLLGIAGFGCSQTTQSSDDVTDQSADNENIEAAINDVSVSGNTQDYTFSVEVKSPDTGCDQYANWWEVIDDQGDLIYRRVLLHSHVDEQPFTRSGGPIEIGPEKFVYVRAHMNKTGYGSEVMSGSVAEGFTADSLASDFASELETTEPLPSDCAF